MLNWKPFPENKPEKDNDYIVRIESQVEKYYGVYPSWSGKFPINGVIAFAEFNPYEPEVKNEY